MLDFSCWLQALGRRRKAPGALNPRTLAFARVLLLHFSYPEKGQRRGGGMGWGGVGWGGGGGGEGLVCATCCRRMFDVQQHEALSQVFMTFCEHAQNPTVYSVFTSLCNVRLIEYIYSWVWLAVGPQRVSRVSLGETVIT